MSSKNYESHVQILGWIHILGNAFVLLLGLLAMILLPAIGFISNDPVTMRVLSVIGTTAAAFFAVLAVPGIIAGYGLLTRRSWARILAIALALLDLLNFPVGTAISIYTFWVLLQQEAAGYFTPLKLA